MAVTLEPTPQLFEVHLTQLSLCGRVVVMTQLLFRGGGVLIWALQ